MDTRGIATDYRMAQWAQRLQARVSSGQSIKAYCESTGINRHAYFYWQRKLREAACAELGKEGPASAKEQVPRGWARLEAREPSGTEASVMVEIGGCQIHVTAETDMGLLVKTCRALRAV